MSLRGLASYSLLLFAAQLAFAASAFAVPSTELEKSDFVQRSRGLDFFRGNQSEQFLGIKQALLFDPKFLAPGDQRMQNMYISLKDFSPQIAEFQKVSEATKSKGRLNSGEIKSLFEGLRLICGLAQAPNRTKLTEVEYLSLCLYTMNEYEPIAVAISNGAPKTPSNLDGVIDALDRALLKLPNYKQEDIVHKQRLSDEALALLQPRSRFKIAQYLSCSKAGVKNDFSGNVKFVISHRTGKDIQKFSTIQGEGEVLIPRNSKFEVIRRERGEDNTTTVYLKQLAD